MVKVEPTVPVAAKGKADAVAAFHLLSIDPGPPVRARRLDSPIVGRERELGLLLKAFEQSVAQSRCVLATVIGMPGVGKSRLVHEFVAAIPDRATILRGRCLPYGEGITFWPVVDVTHEAAGISEGDLPEEARTKIEALLPEGDDRPVIRDRVAAAVGLGEATWSMQETFWAIRKLLESVASDRPLVVVFDDTHWGEPAFLDLVEYLEGWSRSSPILLLSIARPELLETRAGWGSAATEPTTIALDPLTGKESDLLIQNLLGPSVLSDGFRQRIAETAEGNPLFVEEMLGMLIDEDRLQREEGRWVAADEDGSVLAPPSIQGLLAARIEQLPIGERELLQRASVIGKSFWWGAVADLSPSGDRTQIASQLQALVRKGMIRPDQSAFAGQDAFRFRHILIRDAAYESVPRGVRADLHARLAGWIEETVGERIEEYEEIVGYHLEQACQQRLSPKSEDPELAARASRKLASAGRRAFERDDISAALNLLSRASQLSPATDSGNLQTRLLLAQTLQLSGDFRQADSVLSDVDRRARALGDRAIEWRAGLQRADILARTSDTATAELQSTIDRAIEVFTELGDEWGLSRAWSLAGWLRFNAGQAGDARTARLRAASYDKAIDDASHEMWNLVGLVNCAVYGPMPVEEALALCQENLDHVKGHRSHEAALQEKRALLDAMRGEFDVARAGIQYSRAVWQDLGVAAGLAGLTDVAADIEWYAGNPYGVEREWRSGYEAYREMGAGGHLATWAAWLALSLVDLDRDDEAFQLTLESEGLAAVDDITAQVPWREARARILARRGETGEAERLAQEAVTIVEGTDFLTLQGDAQMVLADVLRLAGRADDATEAARRALERYDQKGNIVAAGWARDLLLELTD
jgi:tetratricopeptide (TPR) repeat protein